jgi:hypothetical protein
VRASDLIGAQVVGPGGRHHGHVLDARVVQDGPLMGSFAALRVEALVVGNHGIAQHLGYDRASRTGPFLVRAAVRWLTRNNRLLPWEDARFVGGVVRTDREELDPVPEI